MTMTLISTATVGAGGSSGLEFANIPQTFTDLVLMGSYRTAYAADRQYVEFFFNTFNTSFSYRNLFGTGAGAGSNTTIDGNGGAVSANATANTFSNFVLYIPNYTSSANKSFSFDAVSENNAASTWQSLTAGLWANTAAINRIAIGGVGQTIVQYSTISLYGILKGSGGATVS